MPNQAKLIEWRSREAVAKAMEAAVQAYKRDTLEIEAQLMEAFADEGVHSIKVDSPDGGAIADAYKALLDVAANMTASVAEGLGSKQTIFLWSQWYGVACKDDNGNTDAARFIPAMKAAGLGDLVTESINYNTLGAWLREQMPEGALEPVIPEGIKDVLSAAQKFELRARKA